MENTILHTNNNKKHKITRTKKELILPNIRKLSKKLKVLTLRSAKPINNKKLSYQ